MNSEQARKAVAETFPAPFDKERFLQFVRNLLNKFDEGEDRKFLITKQRLKNAFRDHVNHFERLGTYTAPDGDKMDVLIVHLASEAKLERARTALRNFVADHLKQRDNKDAALVAFVSPTEEQWRFSYVKMEYSAVQTDTGKVKLEEQLTPARRFSYIVGKGESCHTAQSRFLDLLQDTANRPTLAQIEEAFSVEAVTREFFSQYKGLFEDIQAALAKIEAKDKTIGEEFKKKNVNTVDFAKKLMGQIVFLYFLQKKGWLGVEKGKDWGSGPHDFLRKLARGDYGKYDNFFDDVLEPLFYDTLATDRGHEAWCGRFKCRIPFLNGGLFEPLGNYDWKKTHIELPNKLFTNSENTEAGDVGTGILDVFDRYNFTVNEAEPLEKEVAIDPEMLGKVFENLIEENRRKGLGSFYTPREIVHYMCQESLINYLDAAINGTVKATKHEAIGTEKPVQGGLFAKSEKQSVLKMPVNEDLVPRAEIETFVRLGDQISHYEAVETEYKVKMPKSIEKYSRQIDEKLAEITVCDPAVGSGAFPVGMMTEIVRARSALTTYFNDVHDRTPYHFKRHAIQNSLYGADIDPGAVEIAKLRLWLSLVVDEEDVRQIKPLPNLDYKVVGGNSLIGFPFKSARLHDIELLKARFFQETDHERKASLKSEIDRKLDDSFKASLKSLGYEVNFDFKLYFSEVFNARDGFDVVIANPPYGGHIDAYRDLFSRIYPNTTKQFRDIYKVFIELGLTQLCATNGILCYIVPNTLIRQSRYKDARKFLLRYTLLEIVNLGEEVFDEVVVPTCFFFVKKATASGNKVSFKDVALNSKFTGELRTTTPSAIPQVHFSTTSENAFSEERAQLDDSLVPLEEVITFRDAGINYQRVNVGMEEKGKSDLGQRLLYEGKRENHTDVEFWKGEDINRYFIAENTKRFVRLSTVARLKSNERVVLNREFFKTCPKLIWRQTASTLIATVDDRGIWFGRSIQAGVIKPSKTHLDYWYLCAILNSKILRYKYDQLVREKGRVFPQVKWAKLRGLRIPDIEHQKQQPIIDLAKKVVTAKRRNGEADTSNMEQQIDELVYVLYGSTPEEIKLAESATK